MDVTLLSNSVSMCRYVPTKYAPTYNGVQLALKAVQDEDAYDLISKLLKNIVSCLWVKLYASNLSCLSLQLQMSNSLGDFS